MKTETLLQVREALKLMNEVDDTKKFDGLVQLEAILKLKDPQLIKYGYDKVILKELIKLSKFEPLAFLKRILNVLFEHFARDEDEQDELMETLLYRYGLTTEYEVSKECLIRVSGLFDLMDDGVAKHSKQIMQAAEMNTFVSLNQIYVEILEKLKTRLPTRRRVYATRSNEEGGDP